MNTITNAWKKIEEWMFTDEFRHESAEAKIFYLLYGTFGGFCFDQNIRQGFRKSWIAFNILNFVLVNVSSLFYWIHAPIDDYYALLLPALVISALVAKIGIYFWTFLAKDNISKLFDFLYHKKAPVTEKDEQKFAVFCSGTFQKSYTTIIFVLQCCVLIVMAKEHNFETYIQVDGYRIYFYPMFVPFGENVLLCSIIRFIQVITLLPELILLATISTFMYSVVTRIYYKFELLSLFLRNATYSFVRCMDEITNLEMAMVENRISNSETKIQELKIKKALAIGEFLGKVIVAIKRHQELYSIAKMHAGMIRPLCFVLYWEIYFIGVIDAFFFSSILDTTDIRKSLPLFAGLFGMMLCFFVLCFIGEKYQSMNGIISSEIYCSPWYLLEPKDRKLILTFLTITGRPMTIVASGVYAVNLSLFPTYVNNMYSQVQILRTLQSNRLA